MTAGSRMIPVLDRAASCHAASFALITSSDICSMLFATPALPRLWFDLFLNSVAKWRFVLISVQKFHG